VHGVDDAERIGDLLLRPRMVLTTRSWSVMGWPTSVSVPAKRLRRQQ
jgi:hypothetical protein